MLEGWNALWVGLTLQLIVGYAEPAYGCHRFSKWLYPWPQRCAVRMAQIEAPAPPPKPVYMELPGNVDIDIPLPSMDTEFPPDCAEDWCERLKGVGLLRDKLGTN